MPPTHSISLKYPSIPTSCSPVAVVSVENPLSPVSSAYIYLDVGPIHRGTGMLSMVTPSNMNEPRLPETTHSSSFRSGAWTLSTSSVIEFYLT